MRREGEEGPVGANRPGGISSANDVQTLSEDPY